VHAHQQAGMDGKKCAKESRRITGITFASFKEDSTYSGNVPGPWAQLNYQLEGNRVLVTMDIAEAICLMTGCKDIAESGVLQDSETAAKGLQDK